MSPQLVPVSSSPQLPITIVPGDLAPLASLCIPVHMHTPHTNTIINKDIFYFLVGKIFRKVKLTRGARTLLRMGRLWYQWVLVGGFISSRLPCASCNRTASTVLRGLFPRESLCRKRKSLQAPKETDAMGLPGASSRSSSLCSPMWSQPSLYLQWAKHSVGKNLAPSAANGGAASPSRSLKQCWLLTLVAWQAHG